MGEIQQLMDEWDYYKQDEITCPYCGYNHFHSAGYTTNEGDISCEDCGKEFSYVRNKEITYTSKLIK